MAVPLPPAVGLAGSGTPDRSGFFPGFALDRWGMQIATHGGDNGVALLSKAVADIEQGQVGAIEPVQRLESDRSAGQGEPAARSDQ